MCVWSRYVFGICNLYFVKDNNIVVNAQYVFTACTINWFINFQPKEQKNCTRTLPNPLTIMFSNQEFTMKPFSFYNTDRNYLTKC